MPTSPHCPAALLVQAPTEVLGTEHARFTIDLAALLSPHNMAWTDFMPSDWKLGAPFGNGDVGATIHGQPRDLAFSLAKSDVWDRRNDGPSTFPGTTFADFRQVYVDRDEAAKQRLWTEMGARTPVDRPHLTTCGTLRLHLDEGQNPDQIRMRVRLEDGTAQITYTDRTIAALLSREYDVLLIDIDRGVGNVTPNPVADTYDRNLPEAELTWEFSRPPLEGNPRLRTWVEDGVAFATQAFAAGCSYTVGVAVLGAGKVEHTALHGRVIGQLTDMAQRVQLLLTVVSNGDADDPVAEAKRRLTRAEADGPEKILSAHRQWWNEYWHRGLVSVGDAEVEKTYYRSLYMAASCFRPGYQSPGLQGVWCGENYPVWWADYHSNVNIQCIYWGMMANNRLDLMEPYLRLYHGFVDHARAVARDYFQMRGLKFPHAGSIGGHELAAPFATQLATDPCESAWVAQLFWQYYLYTRDETFLREIAYPILRDVALLLADYLTWDAATLRWTLEPVVHFETSGPDTFGNWGTNSLFAQAWFRVGLGQAIAAATHLAADAALCAEWQGKLDNMVDPPIANAGYWKAFENAEPTYAGHNFLLPLVFPAELVSAWHGPQDWQQIAVCTWQQLQAIGLPCCTGKAWCGGQGLLEILRLGDAEAVIAGARWPNAETDHKGFWVPPNGFAVTPGGSYAGSWMQADHIIGMNRVLAECMLLVAGGVIRLFIGIPKDMPARFHSLRAPGGFLLTAEKREQGVDYILVRPTLDTQLRLANPWERASIIDLTDGTHIAECATAVIDITLQPGRTYRITSPGCTAGDAPLMAFHQQLSSACSN